MLGVRHPIVQGPFGGGSSTPRLAAAVTNAGGIGSLGLYHLDPDAIRAVVAETRRLTDGPLNLNLWVPRPAGAEPPRTPDAVAAVRRHLRPFEEELGLPPAGELPEAAPQPFDAQVEAVLEARPAVFSFTFGTPPAEVVAAARARGIRVVGTATTVDEAEAMEAAGVDAVVASGFEAGGHRAAFLRPADESLMGTIALVPQVVRAVRVPVVAAGGMVDGRGIVAALALGADAAQLGTAFLATDESGAEPLHRAVLWDRQRTRQTVLTRAFSGRHARGVRNRFTDAFAAPDAPHLPFPAQAAASRVLRQAAAEAGRGDLVGLWAGQGAPLVRHRHAAELVDALVAEVEEVLAGFRGGHADG
jgi:nitronate monooxygenase